jgi:hypothetical protein
VERNVGDTRMKVDGRLPYGLSTLRAGLIGKQGQRHGEFLSHAANRGHSKGFNLDCEGSWALCDGASIEWDGGPIKVLCREVVQFRTVTFRANVDGSLTR